MPKAGGTVARGYGPAHRKAQAQVAARLKAAGALPCADPAPGCPGLVQLGQRWDLAHDHQDRSRYLGAAHARCNRWWAAFLTNSRKRARQAGRRRPRVPGGVFGPLSQ